MSLRFGSPNLVDHKTRVTIGMKQSPLSKEAFASAILRGAGSAFLHVKNYGDSDVEQELLHGCLSNLVFDTQLNSGRAAWLARMLDCTGNRSKYATAIQAALEAIGDDTSAQDAAQLVGLAGELFERGFVEFKSPLIRLSESAVAGGFCLTLGRTLVDVAGIVGFEYAVRLVMRVTADAWIKKELYRYATEIFDGETQLVSALDRNPPDLVLHQYLRNVKDEDASDDEAPQVKAKQTPSLDDILALIESGPKRMGWEHRAACRSFGKAAASEDVRMLHRLFDQEADPGRLFGYLTVFSNMTIDIAPEKVFALLESEDADLKRSARNVLSRVKSSRVRQRALQALESPNDDEIYVGFSLLELNFVVEDLQLIDKALRRLKDLDYIHWAAMTTVDIAKRCNSDRFSATLLWIYESTPCASCRGKALQLLVDWKAAPMHVLFEAQWDAEPDVRQIARAAFDFANNESIPG